VSGFPRYQHSPAALPLQERAKIRLLAGRIRASFQPGCRPVRTVRLVGHADHDVQRGPAFERKISGDRALQVKEALIRAIGNPRLTSGISWQIHAAGATRMLAPFPRSEQDRARNRRVEILPSAELLCSVPLTSGPEFTAWLQRSLNQALGIRLPVTGRMDPATGNALLSFQTRYRLTPSLNIQQPLVSALALVGRLPLPCQVVPVETDCGALTCPSGALSGTLRPAAGIVFDFCWSTLAFNFQPRGQVDLVGSNFLRFSCRQDRVIACPEGRKLRPTPAWKYEGAVAGSGARLGKSSDWHFGFIQTVRSSRWLAVYSGGAAQECVVNNARDALIGPGQPDMPPWLCAGAVQELCNGKTSVVEDSPFIKVRVNHPQQTSQELRLVCFKAKFEIWLAVKKKADPASSAILLAHKHIEVDRMWRLSPGRSATDTSGWTAFGHQKEVESASGGGRTTPVTTGSTAGQQGSSCFKDTTDTACSEPESDDRNIISDILSCTLPPLTPCATN
jgi:hypothetical protein